MADRNAPDTAPWGVRLCLCEGPCRCMSEKAAIASAAAFLRERFGSRRCDHRAVSCCERCNVQYLVKVAERLVEGSVRYIGPPESDDGRAP